MAIYLNIRVGPLGFRDGSEVFFTGEKPTEEDMYGITRGEGQLLVFELVDSDCSVKFGEAIKSGKFLEDLEGRFKHKLVFNSDDVEVW